MKNFSAVVSATAIAAGIGGGAVAYQAVSSVPEAAVVAKTTDDQVPAPQVRRPGVRFRFAPCKPPAVRDGKACVVDVVQTVVVPAPAAPAAPVVANASYEQSDGDGRDDHGDDGHENHGEDQGENHGEDHGDEDQGEDHGDEDHADEDHADEDHGGDHADD